MAEGAWVFPLDSPGCRAYHRSMSAVTDMLEIPEVRARVTPVSVAQYHRLFPEFTENGRRTELIRGVVVEKLSKSPLHSSTARRLARLLQAALPDGFVLLREDPLTLADSEPEPDLAIVRGTEDDFAARHPSTAALVIEIAVSSAAEDRALRSVYAEAGVEEYWIVLPAEAQVEVHCQPAGGVYLEQCTVGGDQVLESTVVSGIRIRLAELWT